MSDLVELIIEQAKDVQRRLRPEEQCTFISSSSLLIIIIIMIILLFHDYFYYLMIILSVFE